MAENWQNYFIRGTREMRAGILSERRSSCGFPALEVGLSYLDEFLMSGPKWSGFGLIAGATKLVPAIPELPYFKFTLHPAFEWRRNACSSFLSLGRWGYDSPVMFNIPVYAARKERRNNAMKAPRKSA